MSSNQLGELGKIAKEDLGVDFNLTKPADIQKNVQDGFTKVQGMLTDEKKNLGTKVSGIFGKTEGDTKKE